MQITKKAAKTSVIALRRELKALPKAASALSHSECLELMAKAFGYKNWNEWEATLKDDRAADFVPEVPNKYPLVNRGQFDFVKKGESALPFSGDFIRFTGTEERVPAIAEVDLVARPTSGDETDFDIDYAGGSKVIWDDQETQRDAHRFYIFVDEDGEQYPGAQMVLLPEGYKDFESDDIVADEDLPTRTALLDAYVELFKEECQANAALAVEVGSDPYKLENWAEAAADKIGFQLITLETIELVDRLLKA